MPTDYNQDYNSFSDLAAQDQINESFLERWKFNPVRHPFAYAMRMQMLFRLGHTTRAIGYGAFYSPNMFRAFRPFILGASNLLSSTALGGVYAAFSAPPTIGSFAVRTAIFTSLFKHGGIPGVIKGLTSDVPLLDEAGKWINKKMIGLTKPNVWRPSILGGMINKGLIGPKSLSKFYSINRELPQFMFINNVDEFAKRSIKSISTSIYSKQLDKVVKVIRSSKGEIKLTARDIITGTDTDTFIDFLKDVEKKEPLVSKLINRYGKNRAGYKKVHRILRTLVNKLDKYKEFNVFENGLLPTINASSERLYLLAHGLKDDELNELFTGKYKDKLSVFVDRYNDAVKRTYGGVNKALEERGLLYKIKGRHGLRRLFYTTENIPFEQSMVDILRRTFKGVKGSVSKNAYESFMRNLRKGFATDIGLGEAYAKGLSNVILGQYTQNLLYGSLPKTTFGALFHEFKLSVFPSYRDKIFSQYIRRFQEVDFSRFGALSDVELGRLLGIKHVDTTAAKKLLDNFRTAMKGVTKNNGKLTATEVYKMASESFSKDISTTGRLAMGAAFKLLIIGKVASKVGGAAIEGAVNAADNLISTVSRITHLDFGTGRALTTRLASTERTRALQAIQYSGLNARSYLGQESQIYAGAY